jgi:ankyrin repeat protein
MSSAGDPRPRLNLDQQRKRAKDLRRGHGQGDQEAAERILRHLPRARGHSVPQVLAGGLSLSEAQLVVAREAGFPSWPELKRQVERAALAEGDLGDALLDATFAGDEARVAALRARDPRASERSLHVAAALADSDAALGLLAADPGLANRPGGKRGWTPLLYLCCSQHRAGDRQVNAVRLRIAQALLDQGADVNATALDPARTVANLDVTFEHRYHALEGAAGGARSADLVRLLLAAGADSLQASAFLDGAVRSGDPEILELALAAPFKWWRIIWALKLAVELDREEMARGLVSRASAPRVCQPALLEAIRLRRPAHFIEVLLGDDGQPELSRPVRQTAYRAALRFAHAAAAEVLLRRGADPERVGPVDRAIAACVRGDGDELQRLQQTGAYLPRDLQFEDHRILGWAVRNGRDETVRLLLEAGLDPGFPGEDGDTPIHLAVRAGSDGLLDRLLRAGGPASARNMDGETPLELAGALPDADARDRLQRLLLAAGASPLAQPDREDLGELFERAADAVVSGDLEGLRALLDEEPALVHARSPRPHRSTLLHYSGANGVEQHRQQTPPNAPAIAQLLIDRGAEVDAIDRAYAGVETPLYLMMTSCFPEEAGLDGELARVFARAGARIDWGDEDGPMIWAIDGGRQRCAAVFAEAGLRMDNLLFAGAANRVDAIEALLAGGVDVNTRYWAGYTALHAAAVMGHAEAVALLLRRGADPALREEKYGDTPADKARWRRYPEVVALLERPPAV